MPRRRLCFERLYHAVVGGHPARHERHAVTDALDAVVADVDTWDEWTGVAAHAVLERSEW